MRSEGSPESSPSPTVSRRDVLRRAGLAVFAAPLLSRVLAGRPGGPLGGLLDAAEPAAAGGTAAAPRASVLFFTKSAGFEHSVIKRDGTAPSHAGKVLVDLGKAQGFDVLETKDGRIFDSKDLDGFGAILFYTTGVLTETGADKQPPMTAAGKARLLEAIAGGKGFVGMHSATDSFHTPGPSDENQEKPDPYICMLGGEFISHGEQQEATMRVVSPRFPGCEKLGESFKLLEEWYALKNFASDLHVILVNETEGMRNWQYQRPPFPSTWARKHDKGRVFYTAMGHREDVWTNPTFQAVLSGGIQWALGRVEADVTPNLVKAAPHARELGKQPSKR